MDALLDNPVYHALLSGDASRSRGTDRVKFFDEAVSPFVAFSNEDTGGFDELHRLLPPGRRILYATIRTITEPRGWKLVHEIPGLQFVFDAPIPLFSSDLQPVPLSYDDVPAMVQLATLTKPGPFGDRTIDFGHYYGIFDNGQLASMTGQRLHPKGYSEISAVCTHPSQLGKGYAGILLLHQLDLISRQGQVPFLHVRADNQRAIALYERLGFRLRGPMNFYFMKRVP